MIIETATDFKVPAPSNPLLPGAERVIKNDGIANHAFSTGSRLQVHALSDECVA
jgi:hypothetical protein